MKANQGKPSSGLVVQLDGPTKHLITDEMLWSKFTKYGMVRRLFVLDRGSPTKYFVQMSSETSATEIIKAQNGNPVFDECCKMNIKYSTQETLYKLGKPTPQITFDNSCALSNYNSDNWLDELTDKPFEQQYFYIKKSKTSDQKQLSTAINSLYKQNGYELYPKPTTSSTADVSSNYSWGCNYMPYYGMTPMHYEEFQRTEPYVVTFKFEDKLSLTEVYNVFSNFGNIDRICKKQTDVFVVFFNEEASAASQVYLNGKALFGRKLMIMPSRMEELAEKPRQYMQTIIYDPSYDRFTVTKSNSINPPSLVLHISNLKKQTCNEARIRRFFEGQGKIEKIQLQLQIKDKYMAHVKMSNMEDVLNAIATLHNKDLCGKRVHVSFTKKEI